MSAATCLSCSFRSLLPKVGSRQGREQLAHTCQMLGDQRLCLPRCRESERLQAKRQRLQNGVPLINGREGPRATPEEEAHQPIPVLEDCQLTQAQVSLLREIILGTPFAGWGQREGGPILVQTSFLTGRILALSRSFWRTFHLPAGERFHFRVEELLSHSFPFTRITVVLPNRS